MKDLLPIGSVVLLKDATKKLVIIGVLQVNAEQNKMYDYLAVPYPEGYLGQITIICLIRVTLMISSSADIQTLNGIFLSKRLIFCTAKKKLKD